VALSAQELPALDEDISAASAGAESFGCPIAARSICPRVSGI